MPINKVIEILAESDKSWEDAAQMAIKEADKTLNNIRSIYIQEKYATVKNGKIDKYRINAKVCFEVSYNPDLPETWIDN